MTKGQEIVARGGQILLPFAAGDAQVTFSSRRELARWIDAAIASAVASARESCAKVAEGEMDDYHIGDHIADIIRARTQR